MIFRTLFCSVILSSIFLSTSHFHIENNCHVENSPQKSYKSECIISNCNIVKTKLDFTIKQTPYFNYIFTLKLPASTHDLIFLVSNLGTRPPPFSII